MDHREAFRCAQMGFWMFLIRKCKPRKRSYVEMIIRITYDMVRGVHLVRVTLLVQAKYTKHSSITEMDKSDY